MSLTAEQEKSLHRTLRRWIEDERRVVSMIPSYFFRHLSDSTSEG